MSDQWTALRTHRDKTKDRPILSLFDAPDRFEKFSAQTDNMTLDFSKTSLDDTALNLLLDLARARNVEAQRDAMFAGEKINTTENRAALHTALRTRLDVPIIVDGHDVLPGVRATRARAQAFAQGVRHGQITATDGGRFSDVVNIGIGGSDLGPAMATLALAPYHDGPRTHFVSNVDGAHIADTLAGLDPARTLVLIASKTFTTAETMTNARSAISWLEKTLGKAAKAHLAAVSSATDATAEYGIDPARVFGFADWVGGRYSVWGPVGLAVMLAVGPQKFGEFLDGGHAMDQHFRTRPLEKNLPVLLGLIGIWHNNICNYPSRAILPYDQRLSRLPAYFQQLDMESNGKSVAHDGTALMRRSGPIVWGEPGTNGQHAFYQLMHQGTEVIPAEFLLAASGHEPHLKHQHDMLVANCLAQSEALMRGRSPAEAREIVEKQGYPDADISRQAAHRTFPGNRPSITLVYPRLTPFVLGQIIAMFEHRVFTEAVIWGVNPFDQWGVELGKSLAVDLLPMVKGGDASAKDGSTRGLLHSLARLK